MTLRLRPSNLLLASLLLTGCGGGLVIGDFDCDGPMAALTASWGFPDQIDRRIEAGLHIETFWYWKSGVGVTFVWGSELACERRDFSFTPLK